MGEGDGASGNVERPRPTSHRSVSGRLSVRVSSTALIVGLCIIFANAPGGIVLISVLGWVALTVLCNDLGLTVPHRPRAVTIGGDSALESDVYGLPRRLIELFDQMCLEVGFIPSREGRMERFAEIKLRYEDIAHLVPFLPDPSGPVPPYGSNEEQALAKLRVYLRRHVVLVKSRDDAVANAATVGGSDSGVPYVSLDDVRFELNLLRNRHGHPG